MDLANNEPHIQNPRSDSQITKSAQSYGGTSDNVPKVDVENSKINGADSTFSFSGAPRQQKILLFSMGFVNFCACTCFSLLAPFYPTEAAKKGVSVTVVGLVFAVFEFVIFLSAPVFGNYITKIGSKFMFITGVMVCGVCAILFGLLDKCPDGNIFIIMCFLSRTIEALGASAYITASFAILSNEFPNHVATVIGSLETFSGIGLMIGPTIGSLLYEAGGYGVPFFTLGSILIVCALISAYAMPRIDDSGSHNRMSMLNLLRSPLCVVTALCIVCGAYALGFFDPTYANRLKLLGLTVIQIGLMFLIAPGLYAFTAPLWGWIGDTKKLPKTLMIIGNFTMAISFGLLGPSPLLPFLPFELWTQIVGCVCLGIFLGCAIIPAFRTLLDGALQIGFEENFVTFGMVSGLFNSCFSLGAFLGPTGGGISVDHLGFPWAVTVCCGLFILAGSAMLIYCIVERYTDCIPSVPAATKNNANDDPRRLLRKGSCAFSVMYKLVLDSLFSAKLFLTAALHDPVMRLLMEDEWFYDIDPQKALVRFPPQERARRFGEPGTDDYTKKFQEYRTFIVDKLVVLANRFINSLKNNIHCFPAGLGWLVSQIYHILTKAGKLSREKVQAVCADLVFSLFICPAICDPDPHGITSDIHISHIARHNLMQIAQIIQVLAVSQWEEDSRVTDLYERFEKGCVSGLLDALIHGIGTELPGTGAGLGHTHNLTRSSVLITLPQLNMVVGFLRSVLPIVDESVAERKLLEDLIQGLPSNLSTSANSLMNTPSHTPPDTPSSQKKLFKGPKKKLALTPGTNNNEDTASPQPGDSDSSAGKDAEDVLILSLGTDIDCPGMLTETKVLSWEQENKRRKVKYQTPASLFPGDGPPVEIHEKRTRFSLSTDQESIGNTSDIQEAISEAASSHSVGSVDMENDDDNDNFSDMISANVSGRGTPNISGRDTPLSQAESEQEQEPPPPALPETVQKSNRVDVTDRFGKFELERDETKSTVSDTWSTDVLASDSEPPEQNQFDRLEEIREEMVRQSLLARNDIVSEVSETASDAWSTDVLGSDTEEKQAEILSEFDQDDVGSVTDLASISGEQSLPEMQDNVGNEDTPLASGHQSPTEDHPMESGGAVGGASAQPSFTPNTQPRPRGKKNPFAKSNSTPSDSVFEDSDPSVPIMPMRLSTSSHFDHNKLNVPLKPGRGHSSKFSHTKQSNYLSVPDPKSSSHSSDRSYSTGTAENLSFRNPVYNGAKPKEKQRATFAGFGPSQQQHQTGLDLTGFAPVKQSQKHKQVLSWAGPVANEQASLTTNTTGGSLSSNNSQTDLDLLTEQTGNVKLSEQQNTTLADTRRLSAALSMFDPVVDGENDSGDLLDSVSHCSASSKEMIDTLSSVSEDKKMDSEPLIQFADQNEAASSQSANKDVKIPVPRRVSITGVPEILSPSSNNGDVSVNGDEGGATEKRRGSLTSSHSSGSENTSDGAPFTKSSRSTSFDNVSQRSEEKENGDDDQDDKSPDKKKGFFKYFKEKINNGIKRKGGNKHDLQDTPNDLNSSIVSNGHGDGSKSALDESTDDILAKYRKKPQGILSSQNNESGGATGSSVDGVPSTVAFSTHPVKEKRFSIRDEDMTDSPHYDPNNLENCFAFIDAKRKLRIVLSSAEFQVGYTPLDLTYGGVAGREDNNRKDNELVRLLRAQLAEAISLQNKDLIAQLHEAIRCVRMFDNDGLKKLVRALQDEYHSRSAYVSYLIRCRQGLLSTLSHVTRLLNRVSRYKDVCGRHLTSVLVRMFIEKKETSVIKFISDFQKLSVPDEKTDFVEQFLQYLYQNMNQDQIWQASNDSQMEDARVVIERYIMSRIYTHAMFPNGDGDIMRDQILHKHIKMLSQVITPNHKDLGIPRMYHFECPWTAAQREIYMLNAYKTPKDKLQCVQRCAATIMNLLSMANEKSVPAADDFMPVMIYVVIKANPPCMLSTIQFVNSFYGDRLSGEEQYWWMQFSSAVEFIKGMEYSSE